MIQLKSIEEEIADCRKAFEGVAVGTWVRHCHHREPFEKLAEPAENRIVYIRNHKPLEEQALRFRCFRPMSKEDGDSLGAKCAPLYADYQAKRALLYAELDADYQAKLAPLYADYRAKCAPLDADYEAKLSALHREYCTAGCPWDGRTLFPKRED